MADPYKISRHLVDPAMYEVFMVWRQRPDKVMHRLVCVIHEDDMADEIKERCAEEGSVNVWFELGEK